MNPVAFRRIGELAARRAALLAAVGEGGPGASREGCVGERREVVVALVEVVVTEEDPPRVDAVEHVRDEVEAGEVRVGRLQTLALNNLRKSDRSDAGICELRERSVLSERMEFPISASDTLHPVRDVRERVGGEGAADAGCRE